MTKRDLIAAEDPAVLHRRAKELLIGLREGVHPPNSSPQEMRRMIGQLEVSRVEMELQNQDLRERQQQAEQARRAAEEASRQKNRFLADISHELRTPTGAILGMAELLLTEELSPVVTDYVRTIKDSADLLLSLLNEILDFSRMEAGKFLLETAPFGLRATIDETIRSMFVRAHQKGLRLECRVAPDVPDTLVGDALRLRQVLVNLLGNAVKFTEHGGVTLQVALREQTDRLATLEFTVSDTGIGISPEDQKRIFAPFAQGRTGSYGGTGLGLAIATSLTAMMGGGIWVESRAGQGSDFHFTVRLERVRNRDESPASTPLPRGPSLSPFPARALRVLLAEDTAANQKLVSRLLTKRGHTVVIAANGRLAADLAAREPFDVILMDVKMPVMDGFQATAAIRSLEDPVRAGVPILALTAHAMKGDHDRCLAAGMDAYITKPLDTRQLVSLVERLANPAASDGDG